jgi:hypothetical protein
LVMHVVMRSLLLLAAVTGTKGGVGDSRRRFGRRLFRQRL